MWMKATFHKKNFALWLALKEEADMNSEMAYWNNDLGLKTVEAAYNTKQKQVTSAATLLTLRAKKRIFLK